ncbi:MAG TPA: hypothetical protein VNM69_01800 [Bacillus sp. (in: firmicutes)]|uniref:hypothetical protein n=1 Tax=Bacillus litorisediminis TaxID=2922713 RepID=UPI001FACDF3D|nr:hypothetical protein [Bacillus litorisediminis]HWO74632.1 hypothetical protein [Bacillus sp. (in: firmicutes)]
MKLQLILNILMVVLSWMSLPLLGSRNIKRFLPASILIVLLEAVNVQIGRRRKWWIFYNKPKSYFTGEFPFNIGPHLVGSMWILKWTYGNFKCFILLNAIVDAFFCYIVPSFLKRVKIAALHRINNWQFFLYIFHKAFILYGIQYFLEKKFNQTAL